MQGELYPLSHEYSIGVLELPIGMAGGQIVILLLSLIR